MAFIGNFSGSACALALLYCTVVHAADSDTVGSTQSSACASIQAIKIPGVEGCSLYHHYRDAIFDPGLPMQLHLPDNSERSWVITVLGLTLFTEARAENEQSLVAAAASVLNRAGFGTPNYSLDRIADASANNAYSQWFVTSQILAGKRVPWIEKNLEKHHRLTDENLARRRAADSRLLKDPLGYAKAHHSKRYSRKLERSIALAQCIVDRASQPQQPPELMWIHEFGIMFIDPELVAADGDACRTHSRYMSAPGRSYCPASIATGGVCSDSPPTRANACGGGHLSAMQHYQLSSAHSDDEIRNLGSQINAFVSSCTAAPKPLPGMADSTLARTTAAPLPDESLQGPASQMDEDASSSASALLLRSQ